MKRIRNYHAHTWRCQHARGTEAQMVEAAVEQGFELLGFSDHTPWPYRNGFVSGMRMRMDQFDGYVETVLALREQYAGVIEIPLGLECEAFPEYYGWLRDVKAERLDYVLLGNHYDYDDSGDHRRLYPAGGFYFGRCARPAEIIRYAERTVAGMQTGLFDAVAHPDLFLYAYPRFDADCRAVSIDLCQAAKALDLPMEYNLLGLDRRPEAASFGWQGYANPDFWHIAAETGCKAMIGYDAHSPEFLKKRALYDEAHAFLTGLGMTIVDKLNCA